MTGDAIKLLLDGANSFNINISKEMAEMFSVYAEMLKERNQYVNLTAITDDKEIAVKHFLDSLTLAPHILKTGVKNLIDVGSGAGFPGLPLKIIFPQLSVTLLDALEKRVAFLNDVINTLSLTGIEAAHKRAEDAGRDSSYREKFDFATARAVSSMPVLLEYCLPLVKVGGCFAAMKGSKEEEDYNKALQCLGGTFQGKTNFVLYSGEEEIRRLIYMFKKEKNTSTNYPRKPGLPAKKPLI